MKKRWIIIGFMLVAFEAACQDVPGLSYCLLFDSNLEKEAFRADKRASCDPLIFLLAQDSSIDSTSYLAVKQKLSSFADALSEQRARTGRCKPCRFNGMSNPLAMQIFIP